MLSLILIMGKNFIFLMEYRFRCKMEAGFFLVVWWANSINKNEKT